MQECFDGEGSCLGECYSEESPFVTNSDGSLKLKEK